MPVRTCHFERQAGSACFKRSIELPSRSVITFWHFAEQKKVDRHRLHRSSPRVDPQLLQSAAGGMSAVCMKFKRSTQ